MLFLTKQRLALTLNRNFQEGFRLARDKAERSQNGQNLSPVPNGTLRVLLRT